MRNNNGGGLRVSWRAAVGALVSCATLLCGLTVASTAQADESTVDTDLGNAVRIEPATKNGNDYTGTKQYLASSDTVKTPLVFSDKEDDNTLWNIAGWGDNTVYDKAVYAQAPHTVSLKNQQTGFRIKGGNVAWNGEYDGNLNQYNTKVLSWDGNGHGGWESIKVEPAGNGTVALRDTDTGLYFRFDGTNLVTTDKTDAIDDAGHFLLHTSQTTPVAPTDVKVSDIADTVATVSFAEAKDSFVTDYEITATPTTDKSAKTIDIKATTTTVNLEGLTSHTAYTVSVKSLFGNTASAAGEAATFKTTAGAPLPAPKNVKAEEAKDKDGNTTGITLTWDNVDGAKGYEVYRAKSGYAKDSDFVKVSGDQPVNTTTFTDKLADLNKNDKGKTDEYANYYKIRTVNQYDDLSVFDDATASLDQTLFGDHTLVFAPTDDMAKVDKVLADLFAKQNDRGADAQFKSEHWQVYFKPGDYVKNKDSAISTIDLGFYTNINGLGKTPKDTMLNNISIPAYLDSNNATCNFWRAIENLGVKNTGFDNGQAGNGSYRGQYLNWAVAQAAPMRRVWTDRPVAYDWNYGWASGGYVADSQFDGVDNTNQATAGTWSGQQFYTRNSEFKALAYGTTLNNFLQGVTGANNVTSLNTNNSTELKDGDGNKVGVSNWGFGKDGNNNGGDQQVVTSIDSTEKIAEKPFLYLDDNGEYQVFVPGYRKNAKGVSWGKGKDNDGVGVGESIPLSKFYIADPNDDQFAEHVNKAIEDGKNVYLKPGVYHAKSPIDVNRNDVVVLGTGMATIIPDNEDAALKIGDKAKKGVRIAGLIFDAGKHSKYLVKVGDTKNNAGDADDPIELQDIFYRIGGTTDSTTSADYGIVVNTKNTIADHFWIWRADHGAGVGWPSGENKWNYSKSGMVVNGDDVIAYGLFNEHHEEYDTLWNGENGKTFFYQNEKCYDPIFQDSWKSHNGTVNGYAAYKVANGVKNHYAVGLGIYNVFIYTGPEVKNDGNDGSSPTDPNQHTGDGTAAMELDNAVEVPNSKGVVIENVTTQSFADLKDPAKNDKAVRKFNSIVNGVGGKVGSGPNIKSWNRKFLLRYQGNDTKDKDSKTVDGKTGDAKYGTAEYGKDPGLTNTDENGTDVTSKFNKFIGTDKSETVRQLGEEVDLTKLGDLKTAIDAAEAKTKESDYTTKYTAASRKAFEDALAAAKVVYKNLTDTDYLKYDAKASDAKAIDDSLAALNKGLDLNGADYSKLDKAIKKAESQKQSDYTEKTWTPFAAALKAAKGIKRDLKITDQQSIDDAANDLTDKTAALAKKADYSKLDKAIKEAESKKQDEYTSDSWTPFANALASAKGIDRDLADSDQQSIDGATKALTDATAALAKKATEPSEPSKPNEPNKPNEPSKPGNDQSGQQSGQKQSGGRMANTGVSVLVPAVIVLLCAIASGVVLTFRRVKH